MRYLAVGGKTDTEDVSQASHLEALETAKMANKKGPGLGAEEQCWEDSGFEDSNFGFG